MDDFFKINFNKYILYIVCTAFKFKTNKHFIKTKFKKKILLTPGKFKGTKFK